MAIPQIEFAVVDVETTGLAAKRADRIVEIAIIRTDAEGNLHREYSTLINPLRDVGPTSIHGISASDVRDAPTFEAIIGDVVEILAGAIFVSHNVAFDHQFVSAEFARCGHYLPQLQTLCTMRLAHRLAPSLARRRLQDCCSQFGIAINNEHSAYGDARAAAQLLCACLRKARSANPDFLKRLAQASSPPDAGLWPSIAPSRIAFTRKTAVRRLENESDLIGRVIGKLPPLADANADLDAYVSLLDRVLADRILTPDEAGLLYSLAAELGLSQDNIRNAHATYLGQLIETALLDCKISESEHKDLNNVRRLLSIDEHTFDTLLVNARSSINRTEPQTGQVFSPNREVQGKTICFTGEFTCRIGGAPASREMAEELARQRGMTVKKSVSKKLDYLVAADAHSMSGKARKAREYGICIIAEPVFWQMLGVQTG